VCITWYQIGQERGGYNARMNVRPAPAVPGNTESERMDSAVRNIFTVSKEEMQRREAEWQKTKDRDRDFPLK
jgi:hypothetical protein